MAVPRAAHAPILEEIYAHIEVVSQDPLTFQHQALRSILQKHGRCHYLEKLGLEGNTDVESFKATVPISTYADYQEYIEKIMDGDKSPLVCCSPPIAFARSTGTTGGVPKYFLTTQEMDDNNVLVQYYGRAATERSFPSKLPPGVGKVWTTYLAGTRTDTKSGLKASGVTTITLHSEGYRRSYEAVGQASPIEVLQCSDIHQGIYAHLLCGLSHAPVVESIVGVFAFSVVEMFRALKTLWPSVCNDIRNGRVNEEIVRDEGLRKVLLSKVVLSPNPDAAYKIQRECETGDWDGIVLRLFPNLQYFVCACSGSMLPFVAALDAFTRKDFPKIGFGYGASESGHPAFRLAGTDSDSFVLWPTNLYYEFIPVRQSLDGQVSGMALYENEEAKPVELTDVHLGQDYELLLTTPSGLYRYQQMDILRVTDFYKSLPVFKFVAREGVLLSITTDKTDEAELLTVVHKATLESGLSVVNFTSYADHSSTPGHYAIFWEIEEQSGGPQDQPANGACNLPQHQDEALQDCCNLMDSSLNEPYRRGRRNGFIGPLELKIVRTGTFTKLRDLTAQQGGSVTQYKTPRCIVNPAFLALLNEGIDKAFHSTVVEL